MRVLLSGFTPFGKYRMNPSWEAVRRLDGFQAAADVTLIATKLPVVYGQAADRLISSMQAIRPDVIIGVGLAEARTEITPERIAINICDSTFPDNEGTILSDVSIVKDGPAAYWSTLPIHQIVETIGKVGIPARLSDSAGTFVCNNVFYRLMHELDGIGGRIAGGFIHVPLIPEQTKDRPGGGIELGLITEAIKQAAVISARFISSDKCE